MKRMRSRVFAFLAAVLMTLSTVLMGVPANAFAASSISITKQGSWFETAYVEWSNVSDATAYKVYVKGASEADSSYVRIDDELIRKYPTYWRADALGLKAGNYVMKVEAITSSGSVTASTNAISVAAHDRTGFAWVNGSGSGAYNDDGTLKSNAVVLYITKDTVDTVELAVVTSSKGATTACKGITNILNMYKKGYDSRPLCIRIIGTVDNDGLLTSDTSNHAGDMTFSGSGDTKRLSAGITLEGVGEDAVALGWGVRIKNVSNMEVRNIGFMLCDSGEGDDVGLQQSCDHIWVHNCDMFYGMAGGDADQAKGDGALDCKKSTYVTFSYNHFWDNGKCNLLGLSEGTTEGLYITYHHNWYDHSDSRHPRVRYYSAHVYNNYYDGNAKYGVGSTLGSSVFVESNYFRNVKYPILTSMQGTDVFAGGTTRDVTNNATFSKEAGGTIKAFGNVMTGTYYFIPYGSSTYHSGTKDISYNLSGTSSSKDFDAYVVTSASQVVPDSVVSYSGSNTYNNFDTNASIMYKYTTDAAADVPTKVQSNAGRMNQGDFKWEFDDSVDDAAYSVNQGLMSALKSYKTSLVSVGGGSVNDTPEDVVLKGIVISPVSKTLTVGGTTNLTVTANPSNATIKSGVTYTSSNTSVATVSSSGTVTAKAAGSATITAKADGYSATCAITVTSSTIAITGVALSKSSIEMTAGESTTISASALPSNATESLGTVTWSSSNTNVATVSNGQITARAAGTATITATAKGYSATCSVKVNAVGSEAKEKGDAPIAAKLDATYYEDDKEFDLQWISSEVGSGDAKYVIQVARTNTPGEDPVFETIDTVSYAQTYYTYTPKRSGYYTFRVYGKINSTMTEFVYSTADQYVFVPLEAPSVTLKQGDQKINLEWSTTDERVISYDVEYCKADLSKRFDDDAPGYQDYAYTVKTVGTTATTCSFTGLEVNQYYYFKITAHADDGEKSVGYANGYFLKNDASKTFKTVNMGTGAKSGTVSGTFGSKLTITADGSKFADSEDGFTYYYTSVDKAENFIISATFTVLDSTQADNQSAMGIIATDTVATSQNVNFKYFNSITCGACKLIPTTTGGQAIYRVPGVRYVTGYVDSSATVPYDPSSTLANPPGLRKMVNKYVFTNDKDTGFVNGSTYTFTLRKSNTGYEGTMSGSDGTYVLYDPASLLVQDGNKVYVGFFAARNIKVEVTDMVMTTISSANDEAKTEAPPVYLDKSVAIYSASHSTTNNYDFVYRPTFSGTLTVKDDAGNTIVSGQHIDAKEYFTKSITLNKTTTTLTATIVPDKNQLLENYDNVVTTKTITVKKYGTERQTIIVSPFGTALGTGSEENPLDIHTAVAYAQPGQTILLKSGTYNLKEKLTIERGHNGTADKPIRIISECIDNIVADQDNGVTDANGVKFNLAGLDMSTGTAIEVGGDYWQVYGIEVYNTPHDVKTIQVSGSHNTLEMVLVHDVGNSGIQISGSSKETIEHWPSYNTILNCEVYNCCDAKMNDADGFAAKLTSGYGNVFKGCISHHNIDDGWDLYAKSTTGLIGAVVIEDCVTYANGRLTTFEQDKAVGEGNGFKLGGESMPVDHKLVNSISFENGAKGVTSNSNPNGIIDGVICYNNAFISKAENFSLYTNSAKNTNYSVSNLISMSSYSAKQDKRSTVSNGTVTAKSTSLDSNTNFFWTGSASVNKAGTKATTSWFKNTDTTIIPTRNANGTINMHGLLEPTSTLTSAITFDYNKLQNTTGTITDLSATVSTAIANAITDENGVPTKVEVINAPKTTLDGASIDVTGAKVRVTYKSGNVAERDLEKSLLSKTIFYYEEGVTQTVTVEVAEGVSTTFTVTVNQKSPSELKWDVKPASTVELGGTLDVTGAKLLVEYNNGTSEYVPISNEMVDLDSSSAGEKTAVVTYKGLTISYTVTVLEGVSKPITGITLNQTTAKLSVGQTTTLTATIIPSDTTDYKKVIYKSSNESVATVSEGGVITAISEGTASITAYVTASTGIVSARCDVTVTAAGTVPVEEVYTITVSNGTASVSTAKAGTVVTITAGTVEGKTFKNWNVAYGNASIADATSASTTFVMPVSNVVIEAVFETTGGGSTGGDGTQVFTYGCDNTYFTSTAGKKDVSLEVPADGKTYKGAKLDSGKTIKFTTTGDAEVVMYLQGAKAGNKLTLDNETFTLTTALEKYTTTVGAGEHVIQRSSGECWLYYLAVTEKGGSASVEEDADYSKVYTAIGKIPANMSNYTDDSVAAVNAAKNAVQYNLKASQQATVDGYATAIENAINNLVAKGADYSAVDAALARIPANLSNYTDATAAAVVSARDAVVRGKSASEQATVDGYAASIKSAVNALVYKDADYSAVDAAIAKKPNDLSVYTDESVEELQSAINAVVRGKNITEQAIVNGYAERINGAISNLALKNTEASDVTVSYRTHVQDDGWQNFVSNGAVAGTSGRSLRLEGIEIKVEGNPNLEIAYTTHVQEYGWMSNSYDGAMSGTSGESKRLEAIMIQLQGTDADKYDIYYRVHAQEFGWLGWAKNGAPAGSAGFAYRLEAIQIVIVKKGEAAPTTLGGITSGRSESYITAYAAESPSMKLYGDYSISYTTHVQEIGWQNYVRNGEMAGTSGKSLRLEGIKINFVNANTSGSISYRTHVQDYGWLDYVSNGAMSGTTGESKRLEAIEIKLTGAIAEQYDVYYRVHAEDVGWMGWAKNGEQAGTAGFGRRLEGIQIILVKKGETPPAEVNGITSAVSAAFIQNS